MSLAALSPAPLWHARPQSALDHPGGGYPRSHGRPAPCPALRKVQIDLDDGLICFVGQGGIDDRQLPRSARWLAFDQNETGAILSVRAVPRMTELSVIGLLVLASNHQCENVFDFVPSPGRWYMSTELRAIAAALIGADGVRPGRPLYRRAKGLELVCETMAQLRAAALVPHSGTDGLSEVETRRLMAARDMIEAHLQEPLSLNQIAKACGLNRSALTYGFRLLNGVSVATFIGKLRMAQAKSLLLTTDLPVATVGFRCGYRSNASFARAFIRHYGVSPTTMRADPC